MTENNNNTFIYASRYHDFSAGHRVVGHENKCRFLHGHNYRVHFKCCAPAGLDKLGRVIDFGVIKTLLCNWLEDEWDHKFLMWEKDPLRPLFEMADGAAEEVSLMFKSLWICPFNPTAENMARYLLETIGPKRLHGTDVELYHVIVEETRKCSAGAGSYT